MNQITLTAQVRAEQGSKAAGRLRRAGKIPGVIKRISGESTLIALDAHDYEMAMRGHHGDQLLVRIALGEITLSALLRELQHDVVTGQVIPSSAPPTASRTPTASSSRTSAPSTSTASPPTSSKASTSTSRP